MGEGEGVYGKKNPVAKKSGVEQTKNGTLSPRFSSTLAAPL